MIKRLGSDSESVGLADVDTASHLQFKLGSVKTLDEYFEESRIPEIFGVAARVVECLENRVGSGGLSIREIADDVRLSKRTLQRRLSQHGINFSELRDQVRYHYAVKFLVFEMMSIDSISNLLDFSDRTSFTNAFKRWTGLRPSTFRKIFRDYSESRPLNNEYKPVLKNLGDADFSVLLSNDSKFARSVAKLITSEEKDINRLLEIAELPQDLRLHSVDVSGVNFKSDQTIKIDFSDVTLQGKGVRINDVPVDSLGSVKKALNR